MAARVFGEALTACFVLGADKESVRFSQRLF